VPQLSKASKDAAEQFNLIGYSWGAAIVAQQALHESEVRKIRVDNLVLIGAPINKSLVDRLNNSPNIKKIHYIDLTDKGDPIFAGISDFGIIKATPELVTQMTKGTGHFYYAPETAIGTQRRNELANKLKQEGLE
jgi:pimeloyl-ACP methyl ester carboxylesterase